MCVVSGFSRTWFLTGLARSAGRYVLVGDTNDAHTDDEAPDGGPGADRRWCLLQRQSGCTPTDLADLQLRHGQVGTSHVRLQCRRQTGHVEPHEWDAIRVDSDRSGL